MYTSVYFSRARGRVQRAFDAYHPLNVAYFGREIGGTRTALKYRIYETPNMAKNGGRTMEDDCVRAGPVALL